jgi:hypothetical protein
MTDLEYQCQQRERAESYAPPVGEMTEAEFLYEASFYPLPTLRLASMRYISARGRNHKQVLRRYVENLRNPNVNRGDDFRVALGHIMATYESERKRTVDPRDDHERWLDEQAADQADTYASLRADLYGA